MFEEVLKNSVAPVVIAALFLWFMDRASKQNSDVADRAEKQRTENAKQAEIERREHQIVLNNLWATTIKEMMDKVTTSNKEMMEKVTTSNEQVASRISDLNTNMTDQFERLGNTQDILDKLTNLAGTLNKSGPS